jgi:hypothetical protein
VLASHGRNFQTLRSRVYRGESMTRILVNVLAALTIVFTGQVLFSTVVFAQTEPATIRIWDACDPKTFNAAIGAGSCLPGRHGTTKFEFFIEELTEDHIAGAWRFNPLLKASTGTFRLLRLDLASGQQTVLHNKGGETHSFTRVEKFGGGFVPPLNVLSDNPVPAPECLQPPSESNIFVESGETESGPTAGSPALPAGVNDFQCCIHPWMRLRVVVH